MRRQWANGLVERINRFLKSSFKRILDEPNDWEDHLSRLQYVINNNFHAVIKTTPSKLMLGYEQRGHMDRDLSEFINMLAKTNKNFEKERETTRDIALEATEKIRAYNKKYYDKKHTKPSMYKEGEYVLIRDLQAKPGESRKFKANYRGPYVIAKVLNKNRYVITDIPADSILPRNL